MSLAHAHRCWVLGICRTPPTQRTVLFFKPVTVCVKFGQEGLEKSLADMIVRRLCQDYTGGSNCILALRPLFSFQLFCRVASDSRCRARILWFWANAVDVDCKKVTTTPTLLGTRLPHAAFTFLHPITHEDRPFAVAHRPSHSLPCHYSTALVAPLQDQETAPNNDQKPLLLEVSVLGASFAAISSMSCTSFPVPHLCELPACCFSTTSCPHAPVQRDNSSDRAPPSTSQKMLSEVSCNALLPFCLPFLCGLPCLSYAHDSP